MTFNIIDDSQMTAFYVDKLIYRYLILCLLSFNSGHTNRAIWSVWECTFEHIFAIAWNVKCLPTANFKWVIALQVLSKKSLIP